jgi:hypothetical protein
MSSEHPSDEEGPFSVGKSIKIRQITDGTSHTFAVGEAAGGENWPMCLGVGCTAPGADAMDADVPWLSGIPVNEFFLPVLVSSLYACTVEPMNKRPVTNTLSTIAGAADCRSSSSGGPHTMSNFRSDHPRGSHFLLCDGSVRFLIENVDITSYRRLSTIAEGDSSYVP